MKFIIDYIEIIDSLKHTFSFSGPIFFSIHHFTESKIKNAISFT